MVSILCVVALIDHTDYLEVSIYIFGHNVFRNGLILTINHVHVQLSLVTFKEWSELFGTFQATFQSLKEKAEKVGRKRRM